MAALAGGRRGAGMSVAPAARTEAGERFFAAEAERVARLCHACADRFEAGGRLLALGATPPARSDARHVAVEFVHPVIVGKRALPALALAPEQLQALAEPADIVFGFDAGIGDALALARERGCLTVSFGDADAEWRFVPDVADPFVAQELVETTYHLVWELVHVFFEHGARNVHDAGASSFLYPFLGEAEDDIEAVIADVRASVAMKAAEVAALREQTLTDGREAIEGAAAAIAGGGRVLALGNGGSATDAMDLVADLRAAGRPALDLTDDSAILTAIANDIGVEAIFARQVIAHGRAGDVLVAISTSGGSANVLAALAEARRRELATVALVGYDGGRVAAEGLADHVVVTRSEHIPRIQEAQASAYHVLVGLVG
jgi:D-sedoheptulose 7-phosphate isomerase